MAASLIQYPAKNVVVATQVVDMYDNQVRLLCIALFIVLNFGSGGYVVV